MKSLLLLGRQKDIALAELESLYGSENFTRVSEDIVGCMLPAEEIDFHRLGGCVKLAKLVKEYPLSDWSRLEKSISEDILDILNIPIEGKLQFGVSCYGLKLKVEQIRNLGLTLKKNVKQAGQSIRMIPNQNLQLNSAQILHNKLLGPRGFELLIIASNSSYIVGKTIEEQDIDAYSGRDYNRPFRDSRVGMLPPKLAQILINLASPKESDVVLDPFCGTGVVLQETLLDKFIAYGTDIEPRMIDYSEGNIKWIKNIYGIDSETNLEVADATNHEWQHFDCVAAETYLGQAYSSYPDSAKLKTNVQNCDTIISKFLQNIHDKLPIGGKMALALPAWENRIQKNFISLPLLDHLENLGYNRLSFSITRNNDLFYHRPGQIVARQLIVITRN